MSPSPVSIRTPDQRVRVFVSSTLQELAAERAAVRRAIERVRLVPVMFELGARAHAPSSLYRAYLDQSHVFIGIYGDRYGWVAPGMDVSGLEDEYNLVGDKPKLVYIRHSEARDERLVALLDRVRADDDVSYKSFGDLAELEQLVADDLTMLLSEVFLAGEGGTRQRRGFALPSETSSFVGRTDELAEVCGLLRGDSARLVTLTGPGGIGKTRLALRAASESAGVVGEGSVFVELAALSDASQVPDAIATALGVSRGNHGSTLDAVRDHLADRSLLLVLDNFEQLLPAADVVAELLRAAPRLKVLATSRQALRLQGEHEFPVLPLPPTDASSLFFERAGAVRRDLVRDDDTDETVARICRRLEGVPLAIELAAARSRLLSPDALLDRLDHRLDLLVGGARDLPERQRTLRATLSWSYDLLEDDEQTVFHALGVFVGGFSLAAAEAVGGAATTGDLLDVIASLVDKSLLTVETAASEPRFRMLEMIGEFARERLEASGAADVAAERHAVLFRALSLEIGAGVRSREQSHWLQRLARGGDGDNLRAAMAWFLRHGRLDELADMAWALWVPAWIGGRFDEARAITHAALGSSADLSTTSRARLLACAGWFDLWHGDHAEAELMLREALELGASVGDHDALALATLGLSLAADPSGNDEFADRLAQEALGLSRQRGDGWGEAAARTMQGVIHARRGELEQHHELFLDSLAQARAVDDGHLAVIAEVNLAGYLLHKGEVDAAAALLASSVSRQRRIRLTYSMLFLLHGAALLARACGNATLASLLLGAASQHRASIGVSGAGNQAGRTQLIAALQETMAPGEFAATFERGALLSYDEALAAAAQATECRV